MSFCSKDLTLYGITDESFVGDNSLEELVEKALRGGVTMIQYREKHRDDHEFKNMALKLKKICKNYSVPLIINDRVDIALAIDADGVHVGSDDMDPKEVRKLLGDEKIIGVSAKTEEEAKRAQADGADYIGSGAVFTTQSKDTSCIGIEQLTRVSNAVDIPTVAIGGINLENISKLKGTGIAGVSIIRGIFGAEDIESECKKLLEEVEKIL